MFFRWCHVQNDSSLSWLSVLLFLSFRCLHDTFLFFFLCLVFSVFRRKKEYKIQNTLPYGWFQCFVIFLLFLLYFSSFCRNCCVGIVFSCCSVKFINFVYVQSLAKWHLSSNYVYDCVLFFSMFQSPGRTFDGQAGGSSGSGGRGRTRVSAIFLFGRQFHFIF